MEEKEVIKKRLGTIIMIFMIVILLITIGGLCLEIYSIKNTDDVDKDKSQVEGTNLNDLPDTNIQNNGLLNNIPRRF